MEFLLWAISVAQQLGVGYLVYRVVAQCLHPRRSKILSFIAYMGIMMASTIVIFPQDAFNITVALPCFLAANFIGFHGRTLEKAALVAMLFPVAVGVNFLHIDVGGHIFFLYYTEADRMANSLFSTVSYLLVLLFWWLFYRMQAGAMEKIGKVLDRRAWGLVLTICLASFIGIFVYVYFAPDETWKVWPGVLACIVTNIGSIRLASYLADGIYADMERQNLQLQQRYYEELEQNQQQIRKLRHDMNNHLTVAGQFLKEGRPDQAAAYLERLSGAVRSSGRKFCENGVVNAVLNAKYTKMEAAGIDGFFHVSIDGMMLLDDVSLCTIFSNTLDNAIEACLKIPLRTRQDSDDSVNGGSTSNASGADGEGSAAGEGGQVGAAGDAVTRQISLKARYTENGYFSYEIVNTKVNPVRREGGRILTDKGDRTSHGLGLSSVTAIVEKYGGTMDVSYTETEFRVVILIG